MKIINYSFRSSSLLILACLTIYLSSCVPPEIILPGHLTGTVTDDANSDPIQGALVELISGDQSALTDSSGNYEIRGIEPLNHNVRASADDYFTDENSILVQEAEVSSLNFSLEGSGIVNNYPDSLEFWFEFDSLTFMLSNTGKAQMHYSFNLSKPWISIDPVQGFLDESDSVAVTVSIDRTGLSNSTLQEYIQINASRGSAEVDLFVNRVMDMDSNIYNVVEIDDQIWMAENLNVGTRITINPPYASVWDVPEEEMMWETNDIIEKYCYENLESNCDKYGGLYQWWEAMQWWGGENEPSPIGPTQGICPDGWHIPTENDWETLQEYLGGMDTAAWELTEGAVNCANPGPSPNKTGFNALLGGRLDLLHSGWTDFGLATWYWSDSKGATTFVSAFFIGCFFNLDPYPLFSYLNSQGAESAVHVRCIKDP